VLDLVTAFDTEGKPIAFICHAGLVPVSAKILKGQRATSFSAIRGDRESAGVEWVDEATVVDGNLISARGPDDLGPWLKALLEAAQNYRPQVYTRISENFPPTKGEGVGLLRGKSHSGGVADLVDVRPR
jgi:protease I